MNLRQTLFVLWTVSFAVFFTASPLLADGKAENSWPRWRGPGNRGVASGDPPLRFSAAENVKWRIEIPGKGHSTPVIWEDKLFLTTAIPAEPQAEGADGPRRPAGGGAGPLVRHKFVVMAIDRNTGKVLWERTAAEATPHEGYHRRYGSFASGSAVTGGERVYVNFGSRGLYAYSLEGELLWKKDLGRLRMRMAFGEGMTPVVHGKYLVVQHDHEGQSFVAAFDKTTGEELWRAERDERSSWAQPVVAGYEGQKQLVTSSTRVRAYDLETGELIWEAGGLGANAIPAVVNVDNELVIAMTGYRDANAMAIRLGGEGDLTGDPEYILWTNEKGNSYTPSPVLHEGLLYFVTDRGMISAFAARTGEKFYHQQRLPGIYSFKASPVAADGRLYLASEEGDVIVLKLGKSYEVLAVNKMGEETFIASPVVSGPDLFLRSQDELFCIREQGATKQ